ncbi:MAG: SxtJ family membrane protein [Nitrospiraceae bacterium]
MATQPVTETGGSQAIAGIDNISRKTLRDFGLLIGGVAIVYALWPLVFRGEALRAWAMGLGIVSSLLGLVAPTTLHQPYKGWMFVGHILGWINTRIILGVLYYGLVVPMGLVMRLMGKDPMRRALVPELTTYRVVRQRRDPSHMNNMF